MEQNNFNDPKSREQPGNSSYEIHMKQNISDTPYQDTKNSRIPLRLGTVNEVQNKAEDNGRTFKAELQKPSEMGSNNITNAMHVVKNQIISRIFQHNNNITSPQTPSLQQISKCAKMLQQQFPQIKVDNMIKLLQELLANTCKGEQNIEEQSFNSVTQEFDHQLNRNDYSKANALVRERAAVHIPPGARLSEQKKIAISYLNHGYGVRVLRQYIKDPAINSTRYNNVITTIMKLAFRRLQEYIKAMGRSVVPVNSQEEKVIRAPLTNCQKWLPPQQLETFYKFIKLACCLQQKVDINSAYAIQLYDLCIRQLRQRQMNEKNNKIQKNMRGSHRLPRIAQSMYNLIGNFSSHPPNQLKNGFFKNEGMFYPGQGLKMPVGPQFHMDNIQKRRLDPQFQFFQKMNAAPMKPSDKWKQQHNSSKP